MAKDSFVFYLSQYDAIKELTDEQIGRLMRAIFEKQLGKEVVLGNDIKIAFNFINNQMLVDQKKYAETCEKRRLSGKQGGAPKGNKNATKTTKNKQNKLNDNDNENDNDIKKENTKEKIHFAEFVAMTNAEYEKLCSTYGKEFADQCIEVLDNYKGSKGKKYKDDYRAILSWVVDRVKQNNSFNDKYKSKKQVEVDAYMQQTREEWGES